MATVQTFTLANQNDVNLASFPFTGAGPGSMTSAGTAFIGNGAAAFTLNLPTSGQMQAGQSCTVKKTDTGAGAITITPPSGQIDGAATLVISGGSRGHNTVTWDGANWWITV